MLRHGYLRSPIHWHELKEVCPQAIIYYNIRADVSQPDFNGLWIIRDQSRDPDIVIYYAHGKFT
jgi:hypothetical protein